MLLMILLFALESSNFMKEVCAKLENSVGNIGNTKGRSRIFRAQAPCWRTPYFTCVMSTLSFFKKKLKAKNIENAVFKKVGTETGLNNFDFFCIWTTFIDNRIMSSIMFVVLVIVDSLLFRNV